MEQAALRAIAGHLPDGKASIGLKLEIELSQDVRVVIGTKLEAIAKLVDASSENQLTFAMILTDGTRELARGRLTRRLLEPRSKST